VIIPAILPARRLLLAAAMTAVLFACQPPPAPPVEPPAGQSEAPAATPPATHPPGQEAPAGAASDISSPAPAPSGQPREENAAAPPAQAEPAATAGDGGAPPEPSPEAWFYRSKANQPLGRPGLAGSTIYTNDDLQKFSVPPGQDAPDEDGTLDADPQLVAFEQRRAEKKIREADRGKALDELRGQLAALESDLQRLEQREASLRNPLLPPVPATDEEKQQEQGQGAVARIEGIANQKKELQDLIRQAKAQIERLSKP